MIFRIEVKVKICNCANLLLDRILKLTQEYVAYDVE